MTQILRGDAEPEQIGAFLMLIRVRGETPAEVAGFVRAARAILPAPQGTPPDIDWPTYAGKRRHLPWFLLAARLLADAGVRIVLHGAEPAGTRRRTTAEACTTLGIPTLDTPRPDAPLAYVPLSVLAPPLERLLAMRRLLGLRSPVHTLVRMLNPSQARWSLQAVFHPNYAQIHGDAARLLQDPGVVVIKGEGGEFERDPDVAVSVLGITATEMAPESWGPLLTGSRHPKEADLDPARLRAVWCGQEADAYASAAIVGTAALALRWLRGQAPAAALHDAQELWEGRIRALP